MICPCHETNAWKIELKQIKLRPICSWTDQFKGKIAVTLPMEQKKRDQNTEILSFVLSTASF